MLQKEDLREVVAEMVQEVISKGMFKEQPIDNDNVYCDRDEACAHLHITPTTLWRHQQDNQEKDRIIRQKDSIINDYRERIGHYLSTLSELLRGAVKAVLDYVQDGYRSFSYRQECDVKRYMNSQSDKEAAAGTVLKASLPILM